VASQQSAAEPALEAVRLADDGGQSDDLRLGAMAPAHA
jgi:hypothetical protein